MSSAKTKQSATYFLGSIYELHHLDRVKGMVVGRRGAIDVFKKSFFSFLGVGGALGQFLVLKWLTPYINWKS